MVLSSYGTGVDWPWFNLKVHKSFGLVIFPCRMQGFTTEVTCCLTFWYQDWTHFSPLHRFVGPKKLYATIRGLWFLKFGSIEEQRGKSFSKGKYMKPKVVPCGSYMFLWFHSFQKLPPPQHTQNLPKPRLRQHFHFSGKSYLLIRADGTSFSDHLNCNHLPSKMAGNQQRAQNFAMFEEFGSVIRVVDLLFWGKTRFVTIYC